MADTKITALTALTAADPANDVIPIVDVSDTSMAASGTTKKISVNNILGASGTATLASATITGDLTVDTNTLYVNSSLNRVGIGTASPATILDIQSAGSVFARIQNTASSADAYLLVKNTVGEGFFGINATGPYIYTAGSLPITFTTATSERYRIASDGVATWSNVGGVAGTAMTLNANGLGVGVVPSSFGRFGVQGTAGGAGILGMNTDATQCDIQSYNKPLALNRAGNNITMCEGGGNVGIGVTPSAKLDVVVPGAGSPRVRFNGDSDNPFIEFQRFQGTASNFFGSRVQGMFGGMAFWVSNSAAIGSQTFTQAMTLDASGNLLVGKTSTSLTPVGVIAQANGATVSTLAGSTNGTETSVVYSNGAGAYRFYVGMAGTVFATTTVISAISDARYKENVQDIDVGLAAILSLKPRKFDWKAGKGKDIKGDRGFIAQEFETVFPNLIDEWKDPAPEGEAPYKSVRQDLIPVLVKAIQELTARVQTLEAK